MMELAAYDRELEDLEDLIELSEKTSTKIDQLRNQITSVKTILLVAIFSSYAALALGFLLGAQYESELSSQSKLVLTIAAYAVLAIIAIFGMKLFLAIRQKFTKLKKDLENEVRIQKRLLNMIFDQLNIVKSHKNLSIVHFALLEMRIQRLQGS